jgi:hypothetical protein
LEPAGALALLLGYLSPAYFFYVVVQTKAIKSPLAQQWIAIGLTVFGPIAKDSPSVESLREKQEKCLVSGLCHCHAHYWEFPETSN